MDYCAAKDHDACPNHQTSAAIMVKFSDIEGQVVGPCFFPYENASKICGYAEPELTSEENSCYDLYNMLNGLFSS